LFVIVGLMSPVPTIVPPVVPVIPPTFIPKWKQFPLELDESAKRILHGFV